MPKKLPPVKNRFKKGQSGNPGGKPKAPDDIIHARKLNQIELERIVNGYLFKTRNEVTESLKNPSTGMMELMVASIMGKAVQLGDASRLEFILNRLLGKVVDKVQVDSNRVEIALSYNPQGKLNEPTK